MAPGRPQAEAVTDAEPTVPPELVTRLVAHRHEFLGFLERRLGSRAVAEDILQEAFARSLGKLEQLEREESAVAWFYRVLRNSVTDYQRRSGVATRSLEAFSHELETSVAADTDAAVCQCVSGLARNLKPEYAAALQAVEVEGMPVKDFAQAQGISSNNAAVRVFRAREALKLQLRRCCGSCADNGCQDCTCHAPAAPG
ncbi:MAG: sigma-70 family RNA polymerase sigma factor [Myxococcales bacterium]|nr:MAG: sigma-70 family RNA polymerase sigma factor [Myxococcales bacterium]